jgi:NIPSNAP
VKPALEISVEQERSVLLMMRVLLMASLMLVVVAAISAVSVSKAAPDRGSPTSQRIFELRTYHLNEGKLDDLHKRFREHTCGLLKKHGAELIGFWTPTDDKDGKGATLIYLVGFPSREAADKTWKAFSDDPEWQRVREESHKNGTLVKNVDRVFLEPTDYSEMK